MPSVEVHTTQKGSVAHVPAIQKAGMHEAARIAQAIMQREATMAVIAAAGGRVDRARSERLPAPSRPQRPDDRPGQGTRHAHRPPGDRADDNSGRSIDLSA
jgi:hypothetical protein